MHTLREKFAAVACWPVGSRLELHLLLYRLARHYYPDRYLDFLKLRLPWFVGISRADPYGRLETTNRPKQRLVPAWGPFRTRALAQLYEQEVNGLFQIRRCAETLAPHPDHPGCVYGEMNQCLRPCQQAVTVAEYAAEVNRTADFLHSNGRSAIASLSSARDRASENVAFEEAAQIHKRIEKLKSVAQLRDPIITELAEFDGLALTPAREEGKLLLWPMLGGLWQNAIPFEADRLGGGGANKSLDANLRELVTASLTEPRRDGNPVEELAVFCRWYHSSWRDGEWFPFTGAAGTLNYRKLVRELSKMLRLS